MIGPDYAPLFTTGSAAPDATPATGRDPVVLLSRVFGGTAGMTAWFGTALVRAGFDVIAVDHPGSNGRGPITSNGAAWWWERAEDLKAGWKNVQADPELSSHIDATPPRRRRLLRRWIRRTRHRRRTRRWRTLRRLLQEAPK